MWFWRRYQKEFIISHENPFEVVGIRIPCSQGQFEKLKPKTQKKLVEKAKKKLIKENVSEIIFSKTLKKYCAFDEVIEEKRKQIFLSMIPECIRILTGKYGIKLPVDEICIKNERMDRINGYFLDEICYDAARIRICTENTEKAKSICERFYDDTGLPVRVTKNPETVDADIFIDADIMRLCIGTDILIDGNKFEMSLGDYVVDCLDVALCVKNVDFRKRILSYFSVKKS
ncbi:MAG: hypothetical protein J6D15_03220 [Clostridia bacterium]|nr:hypothetical protein [Clostridia bacterium]